MNNININSENFRQNIYDIINKSDLPISNIYFIITLLQKQIELEYYAFLNEIGSSKKESVFQIQQENNEGEQSQENENVEQEEEITEE